MRNVEEHVYNLDYSYQGTEHIIYDQAFYYRRAGTKSVIKYDLKISPNEMAGRSEIIYNVHGPGANYQLYTTRYITFDISADENGVWIIYLEQSSLKIVKVNTRLNNGKNKEWTLDYERGRYRNSVIICGILYLVEQKTDRSGSHKLHVGYAYNLLKNKTIKANLSFTDPFRHNTLLSYNPELKEIFSWDKGYQLSYKMRFK